MAAAVGSNAHGLDAELFTRGKAGQTDNVGVSMVQRHAERMKLEKEQNALQKLSILLPQLGFFTRIMALRETGWDVDKALTLLRAFSAEKEVQLKVLHKKRRKVQKEMQEEQEAREAASSSSDSGSEGSDGEGSDEDRGKKRSGKDKGSKRKRSSKEDKKKKKKRSNEAKEVKAPVPKTLTHSEDFGKFGIIRESDSYAKRNEFLLWALDVKKTDVENLTKYEEKDLFKEYMEDYNTGTLVHRKYYDLEAYERAKAAKAAAKGHKAPKAKVNDEEELRKQRAAEREKLAADRMVDAYRELKYSEKAADMRQQDMLRLQMALAYKTGDTAKAKAIQARLEPEEPGKKK